MRIVDFDVEGPESSQARLRTASKLPSTIPINMNITIITTITITTITISTIAITTIRQMYSPGSNNNNIHVDRNRNEHPRSEYICLIVVIAIV